MSLQDRLKAPPAEDILYEHLGYSIDLVAMALREIGEAQHSDGAREWYRQMSIIEVFWSQARLLIEFFNGSAGSTNTTAAAHFTNAPMIYDFAFGEKDIEKMMNDQIAHMNSERTCDPTKKLRSADMWRVGSAIGRALEQFVESLTDESREVWQIRKSGYQTISADYVTHRRLAIPVARRLKCCRRRPLVQPASQRSRPLASTVQRVQRARLGHQGNSAPPDH
jgi:hypothetical protein